ncbi:NAD(P)-binding protein [Parathielavia hyrcaniae]|uniref:NAD(P)-binding protein n=1 Tax=Parathielavia hyrcaniae TaxID=113614 RepID=A0AAN6Q3H4_9PEZI|nr:NAD(P)-binding protein [Parathielavia hyrcaniae]
MSSAQDKTVIVTGAAGGLGKATATAFLAAGANVVICDVNPDRLASVNEEWAASYPDKFLTQQTDVTDEAAVQKLVDSAITKFGRLDVLVNNAGVMDRFEPAGACSKETWDRVLDINLNGPFLATKAAIAQFEKQESGGGVIINICSTASNQGFKSGAAYTVSKAGLAALTKNTAGFYGDKGIYCIGLILGGMATNITDALAQGMHMEMFQKIQASQSPADASKMVPIESVAKYCVFLADKDISACSNGSCIVFNKNWPEA